MTVTATATALVHAGIELAAGACVAYTAALVSVCAAEVATAALVTRGVFHGAGQRCQWDRLCRQWANQH